MCGIAGYFGTEPPPPERVDRCLRQMHRRGPDAAGSYRSPNSAGRQAVLCSTRLAIIDLDPRANQPFRVGSHVLVYNGELYNYVELRRELAAHGEQFETESDTEVLLKTLVHFGTEGLDRGLDRCEGMWAFAVYNEADGSLFLCRDRFGEKPLYCFREKDEIFFGSEIKFLAALRGRPFEVNEQHVYRYLVNGYKSLYKVRDTFFKGVFELAPGTTLRIDSAGSETSRRFWTPSFVPDEALDLRPSRRLGPRGACSLRQAAAAFGRPAGVLHERRSRFQRAHQHGQKALGLRRPRLYRFERRCAV